MVLRYQHDIVVDFECKSEYVDLPIKEEPSPIESKRITSRIESFEALRSCAEIDNFEESKRRTGLLECDHCGKRYWKKSSLIKHMMQHKHVCEECRENFRLKKNLIQHMQKAHGRLLHHCSICDYKSVTKNLLNDHFVERHTNSFKYPCTICDKQFKVEKFFKRHMKHIHGGSPPIVCSPSGHVSKNEPAMKSHMKHRHYKAAYKCPVCKRSMTTPGNLERHMLLHEKKEFTCLTCGQTFRARRYLTLHVRIHQDSKQFACPVCDNTSLDRTSLEQHILIHTGKRLYKCDICGRTYVQKTALVFHRKKHPGPLPPLPVLPIKNIVTEFMKEHARKSDVVTVKTETSG